MTKIRVILGVIFSIPLDTVFFYSATDDEVENVAIGKRVEVEFGRRKVVGFICKIDYETQKYDLEKTKPILKIIDEKTLLTDDLFELANQMAKYYCCSLGEALWAISPKALAPKRFVVRNYLQENIMSDDFLLPNEEQKTAIDAIQNSILNKKNDVFLLDGVAGSGKTEVYMHCIKTALSHGKDSIFLVPEISLTPQTLFRLKARFGDLVEVFHSQMTETHKFLIWQKILRGEIKILLGPRSSIFAPFKNLGLIVIDEEHDDSYKQEQKPSYDARKVAEFRAKKNKAVVILGSATPSIETFYRKEQNEIKYLKLSRKISYFTPEIETDSRRNEITIIDMKQEFLRKNFSIISNFLKAKITEKLEKKEQVLLFLNRRGESTFVSCRKCGFVFKCSNCDVSLVYHGDKDKLICHYCGFTRENAKICPKCNSPYIKYFGVAIQKVESEIKKLFPNANVARLDRDISEKTGKIFEIYSDFKTQKIDILIGTQIIAKGLDFENLGLVGVISSDTTLNLSDFRANERTFSLLTQLIGRAGRRSKRGQAVIQTYYPEHYAILDAAKQNYLDFYTRELEWRKELLYPPFSSLVLIVLRGKDDEITKNGALEIFENLKQIQDDNIEFLGPYQPDIVKKYNNFRWQILVKIFSFCKNEKISYNNRIFEIVKNYKPKKATKISITIDPVNMN